MKNFTLSAIFIIGLVNMNYFENKESIDIIKNSSSASKKSIVFDLDGVLCATNKLRAFQEIGITTTLEYITTQWKLPSQEELFQTLATTPAERNDDAYNQGIRMPNIMIDWQCAAQSLQNIQESMINQIKSSDKNKIEKELLINTVIMMTTPEMFIRTRQTIPAGVTLLQELKKLGYKLYVLSNWDPTSFPVFIEKFPEIFTYNNQPMFDGIMTSGNTGLLKPNSAIFEHFLSNFNLKSENIIFIDDTIENIQAAQALGISSIHCQNQNINDVTKELSSIV